MNRNILIIHLQNAIDDCECEFKAECLDFDDDTVISVEVTIGEAREIIDALRKEEP